MARTRKHLHIYTSPLHLAVTFLFLLLPFVGLLVVAQLSRVSLARLLSDVGISLWRMVIAYIISLVLAWVIAAAFYRGRRSQIALPIFDVLQSVPSFAALPLATLYWGQSNFTVIFFLVISIIWPLFFSIISSLKLIKQDWNEVVAITGLRGMNYLWKFLLPVTIPGIITGSIIGLGDGWEALVATEIIVQVKQGVGSFFQVFANNPAITTLGILGLLIIIFSINKLIWLPLLDWSHHIMEE